MIDSTLQQELRAKYNPDGSKLREAQMAILEILKYVDGLCRKHNLCYWLSSGTLLGAIRHGGFIPWDDDIDIEMPLKDYRQLRKIIIEENAEYTWQDHSTDPHYWLQFSKLRRRINNRPTQAKSDREVYDGLYIDIFPIESMISCFSQWSNIMFNNWSYRCTHSSKIYMRWIAASRYWCCSSIVTPIMRGISFFSKKAKYHHTYGVYFTRPRHLSSLYNTQDWMFEGVMLRIPQEYDAYLTGLYGSSYAQLPPDSLRITHGNLY